MRVTTYLELIWDESQQRYIADESTWQGYEYDGAVAEAKGNSQAEQHAADQQRQEELNLMQQQLGMINPSLMAIISNGGMLPQLQSAMTSLALNQNAANFRTAAGNVNSALVARGMTGGGNAGSGGVAGAFGALDAAQNMSTLQALENIQLAKGQGLTQALGLSSGLAGMFNQGAQGALSSGVQAAGNADAASTGLWGSILGGAAGLGMAALTGGASEAVNTLGNLHTPSVFPSSGGASSPPSFGGVIGGFPGSWNG